MTVEKLFLVCALCIVFCPADEGAV